MKATNSQQANAVENQQVSQRDKAINDLLSRDVSLDIQVMLGRQQIAIGRLEAKAKELAALVVDQQSAVASTTEEDKEKDDKLKQQAIEIAELKEELKEKLDRIKMLESKT
jgi:hypothetical protein